MPKKKNWASFQRIIELLPKKFVTKLKKFYGWDPGSEIRDPEKTYRIPDPGPGVKRIRIRNTAYCDSEKIASRADSECHELQNQIITAET